MGYKIPAAGAEKKNDDDDGGTLSSVHEGKGIIILWFLISFSPLCSRMSGGAAEPVAS